MEKIKNKLFPCMVLVLLVFTIVSFVSAVDPNVSFIDYAIDTDGNGLYDNLVIEVTLTVPEAGEYEVYLRLEDNLGTKLHNIGIEEFDLDVGENTVQLNFSGMEIYVNGVNGPYELTRFKIREENFSVNLYRDIHITPAYNYEDFERPGASFTNVFSDYGLDEDGDGLYDFLVIESEINVTKEGTYEIEGELLDQLGIEIEDDVRYEDYFDVGTNLIKIYFNGDDILKSGKNGPYILGKITLIGEENHVILDRLDNAHTTSNYNYLDFELEEVISFENVIVRPRTATCGESVTLTADISNRGDDDEKEKVIVNLINQELGIDTSLEINNLKEGETETITFDFIIPDGDLEDRFNFLTLITSYGYKNGEYTKSSSYKIFLVINECGRDITSPTIELISPVDDYTRKTKSSFYEIDFKFKVRDESDIVSCSLIIDDKVDETMTNVLKSVENVFSVDLDRGSYDWKIKCVDSEENEAVSETRDLRIKKRSSSSWKLDMGLCFRLFFK